MLKKWHCICYVFARPALAQLGVDLYTFNCANGPTGNSDEQEFWVVPPTYRQLSMRNCPRIAEYATRVFLRNRVADLIQLIHRADKPYSASGIKRSEIKALTSGVEPSHPTL